MTENERRRYLAGREDWREDQWQDHCGNVACEVCHEDIPWGNPVLAKKRAEEGLHLT